MVLRFVGICQRTGNSATLLQNSPQLGTVQVTNASMPTATMTTAGFCHERREVGLEGETMPRIVLSFLKSVVGSLKLPTYDVSIRAKSRIFAYPTLVPA